MGWEQEIQKAYLQKLADKILPGTTVRNTELAKKAYDALKEPKPTIITISPSGGYWEGGSGGIAASTGGWWDSSMESPQGKGSEWSFTHSGERIAITIYEKDSLEEAKRLATKSLKDLKKMVSKRTP